MKYCTHTHTSITGSTITRIVQIDAETCTTLGLGEQDPNYLAWLAEGNTPEEWQPASEPVIEETPADSTDEEPVTEDGN
jgi:hypothetical protein